MLNNNLKVAILIPTMNRADYVIRQIRYYASVDCPHTIYIGDSSNQANAEKIQAEIEKLKNKINIIYKFLPSLNRGTADTAKYLLSIVKEKYSCYCCDDDFQTSDSLTKCAEFLENNPDYATVSGQALHFRLKSNDVYGELERLSDCPLPAILDEKAGDRLIHFLTNNFVALFFVNRTDQMLKSHELVLELEDHIFSSEIVPSALSIIAGKSTTLDCLGYIRQIHDHSRPQPSPSDWIHSSAWNSSYKIYELATSEAISKIDNISVNEAVKIARYALSGQLLKWLSAERRTHNYSKTASTDINFKIKVLKSARSGIAKSFPFLKHLYRSRLRPKLTTRKKEIYYEALRKGSKYYIDFEPIMKSFTSK